MHKKGLGQEIGLFLITVISLFITVISVRAEEETLTITTYYPSPYGSYRELRSQWMAIGDDYIYATNACWEESGECSVFDTIVPTGTDLIVKGNVGIGTTAPRVKLDVQGTAEIANWMTESLNTNGYAKVGSILIQWGVLTNVSLDQTFHSITFPMIFPHAIFNLQATIHRNDIISGTVAIVVKNLTTTGAQVAGDHDTNTSVGDIHWFAIGY